MRRFYAAEVAGRMGAADHAPGVVLEGFATDSREVGKGDLYIAIRGERVDGHEFCAAAFERGAVAALVERPVEGPHLLVLDVVEALAAFGRSLRDEFAGPVVGLTGSAGKTTSKEMLRAALASLGPVVATQGNRNTEYTSPLLWAEVDQETRAVIVEMGMRGFGQVAHLSSIAKPTVALITNVGYSHLLQVGTREGIARAKGELFEALPTEGACHLWSDDDFATQLRSLAGGRPVRTYGFSPEADCRIEAYSSGGMDNSVSLGVCDGRPWRLELPSAGRHLVLNAAAAILVAATLGCDPREAAERIASAELPPMRMERRARNGATILLDAYNAAPPSVLAAIQTLLETPVSGRRIAVLGEMKELGDMTEEAHRTVGREAAKLDDVIFVGETAELMREEAGKGMVGGLHDVRIFLQTLAPGDVALIKGSRSLGLERALD